MRPKPIPQSCKKSGFITIKWALGSLALIVMLAMVPAGCTTQTNSPIELQFDFRNGAEGWCAGFAQYSPGMPMGLESGIVPLPDELGIQGTGYYLKGTNRSDDLVMFLRHRLGPEDGIVGGETYRVSISVVFASNAPGGVLLTGTDHGENVFLWAGATPQEPEVYLDGGYYRMRLGEGAVLSPLGDIANGLISGEIDLRNPVPYISLGRQCELEELVAASAEGDLWLLVGTRSRFDGPTALYYESITVILEPVE